ncbi:MAG: carotenoid 1,2-hydratase [Gammaproteobacteria bacterium]|nr:MAG: carotenoid 1,2-hydratase [Gammaproteobacteria bacterium]
MGRRHARIPIGAALAAGVACAMAGGAGSTPQAGGFAQALSPRAFAFPRDHGPHREFRQEWWYVTGNLDAATGERFGFELTFFRFALAPGAAPDAAPDAAQRPVSGVATPPPSSAWRTRQIYMAHFALTDVAAGRFRFARKLSREALALAGAQAAPFRVWIDDWSLEAAPSAAVKADKPAAHAPGAVASGATVSGATWTLRAAQPGYEVDLVLEPLTPPVLNGEAGFSRKSAEPGDASFYYSIPRLEVRGRLVRDNHPVAVRGLAWFDREWGSGALGAREVGWDWFALQLNDGATLMFYALRNRDGTRDRHSAGTWVEPSGASRPLTSEEVAIDVLDHWSNARGTRYPSSWRIRVPSLSLEVGVRPVLADQEFRSAPTYWEGAVDVSGTRGGAGIAGRGYVELVGYAAERSSPRATGAKALLGR